MQLLKPYLALFLLLTYTMGFAHGFVPHSHGHEAESSLVVEHGMAHNGHHEKHHHHDHHSDDHSHVAHLDHFDDGLFDLLICLLSETEHSDTENKIVLPLEAAQALKDRLAMAKLVAVAASFVPIIEVDQTAQVYRVTNIPIESSSPLLSAPRRGPPST